MGYERHFSCVYAIYDPRSGEVRYIGMARYYNARKREHRSDLKRGVHPNAYLQASLKGTTPAFHVVERCGHDRLCERERHWITEGRRLGWPLCNHTDGGEEAPSSAPAARAKLSATGTAKWADPQYRANWNAAFVKRWGYEPGCKPCSPPVRMRARRRVRIQLPIYDQELALRIWTAGQQALRAAYKRARPWPAGVRRMDLRQNIKRAQLSVNP
jgi:hypothetical protein